LTPNTLRAVIPVRSPITAIRNKNSGLSWDEATFKDYIKDPRAKIPNTKMIFPGIKNEKEAGDLWAYLKQFGPDGNKK
jgi:cytochrome c